MDSQNFDLVLDPFAGQGDLLRQFNKKNMSVSQLGFDIDHSLKLG
jgi:hypothetical protein